MSFSIAPTVGIVSTRALPRTGPRPLVPAGLLTEGYVTAFGWAAAVLVAGALVCGSLLRSSTRPAAGHAEPAITGAEAPGAGTIRA